MTPVSSASNPLTQVPASKDDIRELLDFHHSKILNHLEKCMSRLVLDGAHLGAPTTPRGNACKEGDLNKDWSYTPRTPPAAHQLSHRPRVPPIPVSVPPEQFPVEGDFVEAEDVEGHYLHGRDPEGSVQAGSCERRASVASNCSLASGVTVSDVASEVIRKSCWSTASKASVKVAAIMCTPSQLRQPQEPPEDRTSLIDAPIEMTTDSTRQALQKWQAFIRHANNGACVRLQDRWYMMNGGEISGFSKPGRTTAYANTDSLSSAIATIIHVRSMSNTDLPPKTHTADTRASRFSQFSAPFQQNRSALCKSLCRTFNERTMLHPNHAARVVWDLIGIILLTHDFVMIPMQVFENGTTGLGDAYINFWEHLDTVGLMFWSCDIFVSFRTGFYSDEGFVEVSPLIVGRQYVRSWFLLDLCIVSVDWCSFLLNLSGDVAYLRLGKVISRTLRIVRLLRFMKLSSKFTEVIERINSELIITLMGVLRLLFGIVMVNHYIACMWYGLSQIDVGRTWADFLPEEDFAFAYVTSLHWSLTQFTPASMEVHPTNVYERIYTIVVIIAAMVAFSSFVSSITGAMTYLRSINAKKAEQDASLRHFFSSNKISQELARMVWHFRRRNVNATKLRLADTDLPVLKCLPERLQEMLRFEVHFPVLHQHPLFALYTDVCPDGMSKICNYAVAVCYILGGEELKDLTGPVHSMLFVRHGVLKYLTNPGEEHDSMNQEASRSLSELIARRTRMSADVRSSTARHVHFKISMSKMADGRSAIDIESGRWACEVALWSESGKIEGILIAGDAGCELVCVNRQEFQDIVLEQGETGAKLVARYAKIFVQHWNSACSDPLYNDILFNDLDIMQDLVDQAASELMIEQSDHGHPKHEKAVNVLNRVSSRLAPGALRKLMGI